MADLHSLIRVRQHSVDQKQKFLAELYRQDEELIAQKQTLVDQMKAEREAIRDMDTEMQTYFGPYAEAVKGRIEDIDEARAKLSKRIDVARDAMRDAFAELKKVEITQERADDAERAAQNKKESDELDDIAIEGFVRNQNK